MTIQRTIWYTTFLQHFLTRLPWGGTEFYIDPDAGDCSLRWAMGDYSHETTVDYKPEHNAAKRGAFLAALIAGEYAAHLQYVVDYNEHGSKSR